MADDKLIRVGIAGRYFTEHYPHASGEEGEVD